MDFVQIAFLAFAAMATIAALGVITVRNPVHSALLLVLTFFSVACTWIISGAEFLGIALVLVYVGAVMVLFLFVVMMLDIDVVPLREGFVRYLPFGLIVAVVMLAEMLTLIGGLFDAAPVGSAMVIEADERFDMGLLPAADWDVRRYSPALVALAWKPSASSSGASRTPSSQT